MKKTFPEVFSEGLGRCTKMTAKIKLKENVQPVFRKKRSIPFAAIDKIDKELERLMQCGVLSKVDYSDWPAPVVYVKKKSGEIRVCADFSTGLNSAIEDHHYLLPSPEEIFTKLNGSRYFLKIDLSEAYPQIHTDDESPKLLCISTHRDLFKYECLPFGVKTAPAVFQQIMDTMIAGLDFATAHVDDILVKSNSIEEHKSFQKIFLNE